MNDTTTPKLPTAGDKCYIHSYHKRDLNSMPCTVLEYREEDDEFLVRVAGSLSSLSSSHPSSYAGQAGSSSADTSSAVSEARPNSQ